MGKPILDIKSQIAVLPLFAALARTATANGSTVDTKDHNPGFAATLNCGAASGTSPTLDVKLQDSDDGSTWADIAGATFAQLTATGAETINVPQRRRYVRAVATIGGTTPSFTFSVLALADKKVSG